MMAEAEHRKPMFEQSGRGFFLLKYVSKYKKFELGKRVSELENQESLRLIDELDLKHLLEDFKIKYDGLLVEFQEKKIECELVKNELKELSESKIGVGNGLKEYQIMCNRLKEHIIKILGDKRIASERDKEAKERILSLEEEIKKMGSDQREKCVEFSKEIMDLECANRIAEGEMEILKKKFADLECGKQRVEDEIEICKKTLTESECGKTRAEDETEVWKKKFTDSECAKRRVEDELKETYRELEIQASEILNHGADLEDYKTKCHGLSTMLKVKEMEYTEFEGKLKDLLLTKVALDHELEDYKTTCSQMKDEITGLTDAGKTMSEREKTAHDRIAYFEELVKKMESDEKDMLVQLKNENMVLECGLKRAEDETENWKKRFTELEMGLGSSQKDEYISRKMDGKVNVASVAHSAKSEKVVSPVLLPGANVSSLHGNSEDVHVSDTPKIKNQCNHSANIKVEQKNICSDTKVELVSEAKQQLGSETGGSCKENLVLLKQDSVTTSSTCIIEIESEDEVIEISDSEDDKEVPSKHTCNNKGEDVEHASTDRTLKTLNKNLKRPLSVSGSRIPFSSTMKRCKTSDTSGSVSQEDDKCPNIKI